MSRSLPNNLNEIKAKKNPRILVVRLDKIGDIILSTPAIKTLRGLFPFADISILIGSWAREVLLKNPHIDTILTLDAPWRDRKILDNPMNMLKNLFSGELLKQILCLRKKKFDIILHLHGNSANTSILAKVQNLLDTIVTGLNDSVKIGTKDLADIYF